MCSAQSQEDAVQAIASRILELSKQRRQNGTSPAVDTELMSKAKEMIATVQTPRDWTTSFLQSVLEGSAMRTLLSLGAIQAIPTAGSISAEELEAKTGAQASLLKRLFRAAIQGNLINLNADGTYSHTPISAAYASDEGDVATLFTHLFDEASILTGFPEYFKKRGAREPDGERATTHNPRTWYYGQEGKTIFEIMEQDPEKVAGFTKLMSIAAQFRPFTGFYDFGKLVPAAAEPDRTVLVDVGGADGITVAKILEAHPDIRPEGCVVQDRESVIELARMNSEMPKGVQLQPHDFFLPQPVKGARAYHLRAICHDWSDTMVIKILSHLAAVMAKDSKVLIADVVLPEGPVSGMAAFMDLGMLCIGGKERTRANFEHVLDAAGLKLDDVYPSGYDSGFGIVEASLK